MGTTDESAVAVQSLRLATAKENADREELFALRERYGLEPSYSPGDVRVTDAAEMLGLSESQVRSAISIGHLCVEKRTVQVRRGKSDSFFLDLRDLIEVSEDVPRWLTASRRLAEQSSERKKTKRKRRQDALMVVREGIRVAVPWRRTTPDEVVVHVGPTNSGKTHFSLERLVEEGEGVYAAPLRFLAREAYTRLSERLGLESVGLLTGEERINENASIICATTEMAPLTGRVLALDEAHWVADRDRGAAWTRLLCAGEYRIVHIASSPDAVPLLQSAFPDAEIRRYERLGPLTFVGERHVDRLPPGTAVVAFSRKAVIGLASHLRRNGVPVATLYGALPVQARRKEIERFANGEAHVLVTTDVIGHGVNVAGLRRVVFAETSKFDGETRRSLEPWEVAQIAGRAGRYGYVDEGEVGVLAGVAWFQPDERLVERSLAPHVQVADDLLGYRRITTASLRPRLADLGVADSGELGVALREWCRLANDGLEAAWVTADECLTQRAWFEELVRWKAVPELPPETAWRMMNAPMNPPGKYDGDSALFRTFVASLLGRSDEADLGRLVDLTTVEGMSLAEAESRGQDLSALRWFANSFPGRCPVTAERAAEAEEAVAARVVSLLQHSLAHGSVGRCTDCGTQCAPWFRYCDPCHDQRRDDYCVY